MSVVAHLCGLGKSETRTVVVTRPPEVRAAVKAAHADGFALVEPDLPIGRLELPRDVVDRAVLATVVRGQPRELLFVRGHEGGVVKVRAATILDLWITPREAMAATSPFVEVALGIVASHADGILGKELLREARTHRSASTTDGGELAKALVRAWNDGLVSVSART